MKLEFNQVVKKYDGFQLDCTMTVEEGCVFVLGDNRGISQDSRYPSIGQIDTREILGKAIFLIFPGTNYDQEDREYSRIGVFE